MEKMSGPLREPMLVLVLVLVLVLLFGAWSRIVFEAEEPTTSKRFVGSWQDCYSCSVAV